MKTYLCLAIVLSATSAFAQTSSWESSPQNWLNSPGNWSNNPRNYGSGNRVYGSDGSLEGYTIPRSDGSVDVYEYPEEHRPAYGSNRGADYSAYGADGYLRR
jgi:hypothetical protein